MAVPSSAILHIWFFYIYCLMFLLSPSASHISPHRFWKYLLWKGNKDITASLPLLVMWKMNHCTNMIRLASCPLMAYTVKVNMVAIIQIVWVVPGKKQSVSWLHTLCAVLGRWSFLLNVINMTCCFNNFLQRKFKMSNMMLLVSMAAPVLCFISANINNK